jgi:hypothetical protein
MRGSAAHVFFTLPFLLEQYPVNLGLCKLVEQPKSVLLHFLIMGKGSATGSKTMKGRLQKYIPPPGPGFLLK